MLEIGATYTVKHRRKGTFTGVVLEQGGEWVRLRLVAPQLLLGASTDWVPGEEITVRASLATFTRLPAKGKEVAP